ncbi:type II secretion system protein [Rugamonas sp. CCM 8940]|uniref:type II secretion system protein n=1 Tax=Rugamonas sp. CCM 8940 TaxID=2765359 RepID=UPI0018F51A55|nr:type II secretion system protein [Rugamonas sp. CCM 8940]MBJ7312581.1 type II secretion system protein [Rugamonas sp. CCM 8940]
MTAAADRTPTGSRRQGGFTYLSLIILVAMIGLVAASTLKMGALLQRARAEQELLNIGAEFSDALQSYANATPAGQPPQPPSLKELLKDPRFPGVRRHLRKLFVDPLTGSAEWGVVYLADKVGVIGIYSLSDAKAIKLSNFPTRFQAFEGKSMVADWKFTMNGKAASTAAPALTPRGGPVAPATDTAGVPVAPPVTAPVAEVEVEVEVEPPPAPAPPEPEPQQPPPATEEAPSAPIDPRKSL